MVRELLQQRLRVVRRIIVDDLGRELAVDRVNVTTEARTHVRFDLLDLLQTSTLHELLARLLVARQDLRELPNDVLEDVRRRLLRMSMCARMCV